jgi:RNA polymerase sigma factor (sigma-70 family)
MRAVFFWKTAKGHNEKTPVRKPAIPSRRERRERVEIDMYRDQVGQLAGDYLGLEEGECSLDCEEGRNGCKQETRDIESNRSEPAPDTPFTPGGLYFREIGEVPLLTAEQERHLAMRIEEGEKRIKAHLLESPLGLEWMRRAVRQAESGEIRATDIFAGSPPAPNGTPDDPALARHFRTLSEELLRRSATGGIPHNHHVPGNGETVEGENDVAPTERSIENLLDQLPLKSQILADLEVALRQRLESVDSDTSTRRDLVDVLVEIEKVKEDVKEAREEFVRSNLRLVVAIAKRYVHRGLSLADLIQEGNIGLMKAVDRFDHRKGCRFATYASWWILQGITRAIAEQARMIRIPVHIIESETRVLKTFESLINQWGRRPTASEVASAANLPRERVEKLLEIPMAPPVSLETPMGEKGVELGNFVADDHGVSPLAMTMQSNLTLEISKALVFLTPREAKILRMRFGIGEIREYTLEELGQRFGITRERIRQIEGKALQKLRNSDNRESLRSFYD